MGKEYVRKHIVLNTDREGRIDITRQQEKRGVRYLIRQTPNLFTCHFQIFLILFDIYTSSVWNYFVQSSKKKKKVVGILIGLVLNLYNDLGEKNDVFTVLRLLGIHHMFVFLRNLCSLEVRVFSSL